MPSLKRWLLRLLAVLSLGMALIGVVVPGLPTTEFVLLSAWAAARSSPRLHAWLLGHRLFGPMLHNWGNGRRVARRAKWAATVSMSLCALLMWHSIPHPGPVAVVVLCMACGLVWLWRRPEPEVPPAPGRVAASGNTPD